MNDDNVHWLDEGPSVPLVNLPNALTVLRLVMVPVFVWLMVLDGDAARWWALVVFVVAAATDQLDGHLARSWNLVTDFGRIVDPIADKALTLGAFVMLSVDGLVPWWFTVLVAVRELGITALRAVLLRRGIVVAANSGGKLKTVLQMLFIFLMLLPWGSFLGEGPAGAIRIAAWVVGGAALALTLWSGGVYVVEGARLMRATRADGTPAVGDPQG